MCVCLLHCSCAKGRDERPRRLGMRGNDGQWHSDKIGSVNNAQLVLWCVYRSVDDDNWNLYNAQVICINLGPFSSVFILFFGTTIRPTRMAPYTTPQQNLNKTSARQAKSTWRSFQRMSRITEARIVYLTEHIYPIFNECAPHALFPWRMSSCFELRQTPQKNVWTKYTSSI